MAGTGLPASGRWYTAADPGRYDVFDPENGVTSGTSYYDQFYKNMGVGTDKFARGLGYNGPDTYDYSQESGQYAPNAGATAQLQQWMDQTGNRLAVNPETKKAAWLGPDGKPIEGSEFSTEVDDSQFWNAAMLAAAVTGANVYGASAAGGASASASGGAAAAADPVSAYLTSGAAEGSTLASGVTGAGGSVGAVGSGSTAGVVANVGKAAGAAMEFGNWIDTAAKVVNTVGTVVGLTEAKKAGDATNEAVAGQTAAAKSAMQIAQEQWDFQRDVYLPKAMAAADETLKISRQLADKQIEDSDFYRGIAKEQFDQAKKSWKYQDQLMGLADDYSSGKAGTELAGRANADVEQAFGNVEGAAIRGAQRFGINPSSGAYAAAAGDLYQRKALAGAGAQTNARLQARDRAQQLVAMAAGAGQAGFGTGAQLSGLATNSTAGAANTNANSGTPYNTVSSTFTSGGNGSINAINSGASAWNGAARTAGSNPWAGFATGLANSARSWYQGNGTASIDKGTGLPSYALDPYGP